jgi:hypothetical protein
MLAVTLGVCIYAYPRHGAVGIAAALIAGFVNWIGAMGAMSLIAVLRGGPWVIHGLLAGMLVRTGLPLFAGLLLTHLAGPLAGAGVFGMILVCYLVGLAAETLISVRLIGLPTGQWAQTA